MAKKKKRNKGKTKTICCPNIITKVKGKKNKGSLTALEMMELCDKLTIFPKKVEILKW